MPGQLGVVMDPITSIKPYKDTSYALLLAAQQRGWQLFYMEQGDLWLRDGQVQARMTPLTLSADPAQFYALGSPVDRHLSELDAVLMRKDPPFDMEYVYSTYLLELAQSKGCCVINDPRSIRDCNEKLFAAWFPTLTPPTLVTRDKARIKAFAAEQGRIVVKPLDGMGGTGVFVSAADDPNLSSIVEMLTAMGRQMVMAQRYLPEIKHGDKRILMINGEPASHCLARIPAQGEARGNLAAGGTGVVQPLSERDRYLAAQVGPELRRRGLSFVGLDVIGDFITEINVTSPTCLQEIARETGVDLAGQFAEGLPALIAACKR